MGDTAAPAAAPGRNGQPRTRIGELYRSARSSLFWLVLARQKPWIVAMLVLGAVLFALTILTAQVTAAVFDEAIIEQNRPLDGLVRTLVVLAVLDFVFGLANRQVTARLGYQIEFDLRNLLYLQLQRTNPRTLDSVATGQVVTRALTDLRILEAVMRVVPELLRGVPILAGLIVYMLYLNVPLTLVAASALPINIYLVNRIRKRLWGLSYMGLNQRAQVTTSIDEPVRGIRVVKAFGQEEGARSRVAEAARKAYEYAMSRVRLQAKYDLLLRAAPMLVRAGLLIVGARLAIAGHISIGQLVVFFGFSAVLVGMALLLDEIVAAWQMAKTGVGRMFQLFSMAPPRSARPDYEPLPDPSTGLELRRVGVAFGAGPVLSGLELSAGPGELVVVAGGPGSGKSTLAGLASGSVAPSEGVVLLDGVDVGRLDPSDLHRCVHIASEDTFLFARSVRENLTVGALAGTDEINVRVDDDTLDAAVRAAAAEDVVAELAHGLDTVLGDRGMTLSGGQRQRLALARALVRPPRVLVLDDALAAVNPALEVEILRRIRAHAPETAIVCMSRRPGPRALADRVVELPAAGSHQERLSLAQASGAALAGADAATGGGGAPVAVAAHPLLGQGADLPYDDRLLGIIEDLRFSGDQPRISEASATEDEAPGVRNLLRPVTRWLLQGAALLLVLTAVGLSPEYLLGSATDAIEARDSAATDRFALALAAIAAATGMLTFMFRIVSNRVNQELMYALRRRVFQRLSKLGIEYYDREMPGYVSTRVVHDLDVVSDFMEEGFYRLVSSVALFFGAMAIMAWLSIDVALIVLGFATVVLLVTLANLPIADRAYQRARMAVGEVVSRLQEDFAGRYVMSAFGAERRARIEFGQRTLELRRARRYATTVSNVYTEALGLISSLAVALIFLRAGSLAIAGVLSTGMVFSLRLYLSEAMRPIPQMGRIWQDYLQARVAFRQLAQPFQVPVRPEQRAGALACPPLAGDILFDHVAFRYPGTDRPVLHGVTLSVAPGDVVAVVGYTGAGKSSLAKLLGRVYDPEPGRILVDGHDLRDLDLNSYRRRLGVVPQDDFIFRGNVYDNLTYGKPDATRDEVEAAVRDVGAWETLSALPRGLDTLTEEEGRNLTAAERQLISLARAWLIGPDILVLDEATAALDADTEQRVLDAVTGLGVSTILITHRLPVAERAHAAFVLDGGQVVEAGEPAHLMAAGGSYAALWAQEGQAGGTRRKNRARAGASTARKAAAGLATAAGNGAAPTGNGTRTAASKNGAKAVKRVTAKKAAAKKTAAAKKKAAKKKAAKKKAARPSGAGARDGEV